MFCPAAFDQWRTTILHHLPPLRKPQAPVLALWSFGMVLARSCALSAVSHLRAKGMRRKEQTGRQQRRAWYDDVRRKRGTTRQILRVETCFPLLVGGVIRWWQGTPLALAIEATALGARCVVWAVRGVYRGGAMPVAWVVLPAKTTHAWRRAWWRLLRWLRPAIPRQWTVIVLADRGWQAPWLFRRLVRLGWPPFLRSKTGGTLRPAGASCFRPWQTFVPQPGTRWRGRGTAFQKAGQHVEGTLLALWEEGQKDPWLLLTDLPPEASEAGWYGLRAWIAQGFQCTKRAGWQGQRTRMSAPDRAARLWLAVAVATLWLLSVGEATDAALPDRTLLDVTGLCPGRPRTRRATRLRLVSVFRQGWVTLLVALRRHDPLPQGRFVPEPWPAVPAWEEEAPAPHMVLPEAA